MCDAAAKRESYKGDNDILYEGEPGWLFRREELEGRIDVTPQLFETARALSAYLAKYGTRLIVAIPPPRALLARKHLSDIRPAFPAPDARGLLIQYLRIQSRLKASGALVPDILGEANRNRVRWEYLTTPHDVHWSPLGAQVAARAIGQIVRGDAVIRAAPRKTFRFARNGKPVIFDGYYMILDRICGGHFPVPTRPAFSPTEETSTAGLLETQSAPSIVLTGTSFSALEHRFNFGGFLAKYSGVDVINLGIAGGGPLTSLAQYLASGEIKSARPRFLIWELSPTNIPGAADLDQLSAYLRPACSKQSIASRKRFSLGETRLFDRPSLALLKGDSGATMLMINSSNPALKIFDVVVRDIDGRQKHIEIDFSRASALAPNYRLMLEGVSRARSVSIVPKQTVRGIVAARLCNPDVKPKAGWL